MKKRRPVRKRPLGKIARAKRQRLGLRISKGLELLRELPEGVLSEHEQNILRRIQDIHTGVVVGRLTEVDFENMRRIAEKHNMRIG